MCYRKLTKLTEVTTGNLLIYFANIILDDLLINFGLISSSKKEFSIISILVFESTQPQIISTNKLREPWCSVHNKTSTFIKKLAVRLTNIITLPRLGVILDIKHLGKNCKKQPCNQTYIRPSLHVSRKSLIRNGTYKECS